MIIEVKSLPKVVKMDSNQVCITCKHILIFDFWKNYNPYGKIIGKNRKRFCFNGSRYIVRWFGFDLDI